MNNCFRLSILVRRYLNTKKINEGKAFFEGGMVRQAHHAFLDKLTMHSSTSSPIHSSISSPLIL